MGRRNHHRTFPRQAVNLRRKQARIAGYIRQKNHRFLCHVRRPLIQLSHISLTVIFGNHLRHLDDHPNVIEMAKVTAGSVHLIPEYTQMARDDLIIAFRLL